MTDITTGTVVCSRAGHDKGQLFCIVGLEDERLLLCDGKRRKLAAPKHKKAKHIEPVGQLDHPVLEQLRCQESVTDHALRKALAAFRAQVRRL